MLDALKRLAGSQPDKLAAVMADGSGPCNYAELDRRADRMAAALQRLGVGEGDTVALLHDNGTAALELWWGARRAGAYYAPLSTHSTPVELAYIVQDCAAVALIATAGQVVLAAGLKAVFHEIAAFSWGARDKRLRPLEAELEAADTAPRPVVRYGRELIYSSGTTGKPRGIRRSLAPIEDADRTPAFEQRLRAMFGINREAVYLAVSPLYHATGRFLNRVMEAGGTVVIAPRFDPDASLAAIARHRVTLTQWVPTMFNRLLALPDTAKRRYDLSSHHLALHAAAQCPVAVKRAMIDWWGPILAEYYGGSENAGVTFITSPEWLAHPGSVGRSITGPIHILDEAGGENELGPGDVGSVYFEGGVPFEYMNAAPGAAAPRTSQGYTGYGDLGRVDADGYLYISDRRSDLIISGGVNVYPREIELVLDSHPAVDECAVIGMTDADYGQQVKAVVRLTGDVEPSVETAAALVAFCRERLSSIKCPRSVDFVDALPRNDQGKLLKRELRARYEPIS